MKPKFNVIGLNKSGDFIGFDKRPISFEGMPVLIKAARKMIKAYKAKLNPHDPKRTYSAKFSVDDLDYIKYMMEANEADGVNIYFSLYPDDGSLNPCTPSDPSKACMPTDLKKPYEGRNTILFVLTRSGDDTFDVDADSDLTGDEAREYQAYNHGELNP